MKDFITGISRSGAIDRLITDDGGSNSSHDKWENVFLSLVDIAHEHASTASFMKALAHIGLQVPGLSSPVSGRVAHTILERARLQSRDAKQGIMQGLEGARPNPRTLHPLWPIHMTPPDVLHPQSYLEDVCHGLSIRTILAIRVIVNHLAVSDL